MYAEAPIDALLLDMDGVLYHGNTPLPGAADFLTRIAHVPHLFVTNNPIRTPEQVAERFEAIGLPRPAPEQILTSAAATAAWLAAERPGFRFFAVGADGLHRALRAAGGREDREQADFVVVGEGPGLDFDSLSTGIDLIVKRGARLVVTNPDTSVDDHHDGRHRVLPGGGALVAPFALASGVEPIVIGKPEPALFRMAAGTAWVRAAARARGRALRHDRRPPRHRHRRRRPLRHPRGAGAHRSLRPRRALAQPPTPSTLGPRRPRHACRGPCATAAEAVLMGL